MMTKAGEVVGTMMVLSRDKAQEGAKVGTAKIEKATNQHTLSKLSFRYPH